MNSLEYYTQHSLITNPREHRHLFNGLPDDIPGLVRIVQGLLIHPFCVQLYHVQLTSRQRAEVYLRSVAQILGRIHEIEASPLTVPREPMQRLIGNCRDHAVLFVAMLRHQGIPARLRVGFASYLSPKKNEDHWVTEYWHADQQRWVLIDPQIDEVQREAYHISFDTLDMRFYEHFYTAGQAWQRCKNGVQKPANFGFRKWKGWRYIRTNLLFDLMALNRIELLPGEEVGELMRKGEQDVTTEERALLDRVAELTVNVDVHFDELRTTYDTMPQSREAAAKLKLLGLSEESESPASKSLSPSGNERLAKVLLKRHDLLVPRSAWNADLGRSASDTTRSVERDKDSNVPFAPGDIVIYGAQQHNLKNIDVAIPRHRFVVVTGVSGSGKSSLAIDTLYAEGQRRYVESLSAYARQFLEQMEKPKVAHISGLAPAIAIEQKTVSKNPRSTVGTITEIFDYLRVLFSRIGVLHCPQCGRGVKPQKAFEIALQIVTLPPGTRFQLLIPNAQPYERSTAWVTVPENELERRTTFRTQLIERVQTTLTAGNGVIVIRLKDGEEILLTDRQTCPVCDLNLPELTAQLFSFNSPAGMCHACNGLGVQLSVDPALVVPQPHLSLLDGACPWYGDLRSKNRHWVRGSLQALANHYAVDLELPWQELSEAFRNAFLYGTGNERIRMLHEAEWKQVSWKAEHVRPFEGVVNNIRRLFRQTRSEGRRRYCLQFMSQQPCTTCNGERLCPEARFTTVGAQRFPEVTRMTIAQAHQWVNDLFRELQADQLEIGSEVLKELRTRLQFMLNVGLHYLTLDRSAPTLSGGEGQRIRLASQLGCGLSGVLYVLDEPSIGLHPRDHHALLDTLKQLRNLGNTVLVIEHDADTMRAADWLIDLGPGAGELGGYVIAAGTPDEVMAQPESLTGQYLSGQKRVSAPNDAGRRAPKGWLTVAGARLFNLKTVTARFPLGVMTCVTGVSGSGKSSLISKTLYPALARALHRAQAIPGPHDRIEGLEQVDKIINITQDPIGRTPRSNPGTYVQAFDEIRKVFAATPEAKARKYGAGRFSFNVKGGYCDECKGHGRKRIEMHFLPDVWVTCKACNGQRFNQHTLEILYKGKTIADVLDMDVQEALDFFADSPKITRILHTLHDVGLDYIKLGQSALTLSGGEAQRVKLAKELSRVETGRTVHILDEPTTGLHFADIQRLLDVLHRLTDAGNTVIIIEHNLDVIKTADWILDLGPEGGEAGGYIVAQGTPEDVAQVTESYTGQFLNRVL